MKNKNLFLGSCVALVTPFKDNKINYYSLKNLIEYQLASGTNAILILGTTGEASTISYQEREKLIKFCVCLINKKVPLIVGTGSNCTSKSIKFSKQAQKLGADAVLCVTPYYNKCNQNGLFEHFYAIAHSITIPVILYNIPSRTGVNILPETVLKLSKINNIIAIKDCSSLNQMAELINILPKNFAVYSGDDLLSLPAISIGAKGVISVTANCYPEKVVLMCNYALSNDFYNALNIHNLLYQINKALFLDVNPICIKYYLNLIGFDVGTPRLPLTEPNCTIKNQINKIKEFYEN